MMTNNDADNDHLELSFIWFPCGPTSPTSSSKNGGNRGLALAALVQSGCIPSSLPQQYKKVELIWGTCPYVDCIG